MNLSNQQKGTLLAFTAIMFITPDSLLIRLSNTESWNLIFYRGFIPFFAVFIGLLVFHKGKFISSLLSNGWHGAAYVCTFAISNILFVLSIENTNVANTLVMVALAPMLSAIISLIFLKENPDIAKEIENKILENAGIVEKAMMEGETNYIKKEKDVKIDLDS